MFSHDFDSPPESEELYVEFPHALDAYARGLSPDVRVGFIRTHRDMSPQEKGDIEARNASYEEVITSAAYPIANVIDDQEGKRKDTSQYINSLISGYDRFRKNPKEQDQFTRDIIKKATQIARQRKPLPD